MQPCWHECPRCKKDWFHLVKIHEPLDEFFQPCPACAAQINSDGQQHDRGNGNGAALPTERETSLGSQGQPQPAPVGEAAGRADNPGEDRSPSLCHSGCAPPLARAPESGEPALPVVSERLVR